MIVFLRILQNDLDLLLLFDAQAGDVIIIYKTDFSDIVARF